MIIHYTREHVCERTRVSTICYDALYGFFVFRLLRYLLHNDT